MDINTAPQPEFAETAEGFNHHISMDTKGSTQPASKKIPIFLSFAMHSQILLLLNQLLKMMLKLLRMFYKNNGFYFTAHQTYYSQAVVWNILKLLLQICAVFWHQISTKTYSHSLGEQLH